MERIRIVLVCCLLINQLASGQTWNQGGNAFAVTGKIGTTDNNNMDFYTNNVLRARINNTGLLTLFSGLTISSGSAAFANGILLDNGAPYQPRIFTGGTLQLQGNATTSPQVYIHNAIGASFTGSSVVEMGTGSATLSASQNILAILGNTAMVGTVFKANGNVGIGTSTPSQKLEVAGNVQLLTGANKLYINELAAFDPTLAGLRNNAGNLVINAVNNGTLYLNRDISADTRIQSTVGGVTTDIAIFKSTGSVGIGTINVGDVNYKLFVETGIRTRKIKVDQSAWPDYVFDKHYSLLPIDELKSFIETHKHLPDLQSAESIAKNGVDLGDNQAILLKKIEELTLYIVKLNDKLEQQSRDIQSIRNENVSIKLRSKSKK